MISGGMFLSYGVFNIFIGYQSLSVGKSPSAVVLVLASFHITVVAGAVATCLINNSVNVLKIHVGSIRIQN